MRKSGLAGFPYYLGIKSLDQVASAADRVCVLNILGGESRQVTPVKRMASRRLVEWFQRRASAV